MHTERFYMMAGKGATSWFCAWRETWSITRVTVIDKSRPLTGEKHSAALYKARGQFFQWVFFRWML